MPSPRCPSENTRKKDHNLTVNKTLNVRIIIDNLWKIPDINSLAKKPEIIGRLPEKISLGGIARATRVSPRGLQYYVNQKLASVPQELKVPPQKKGKLIVQCNEMSSFVSFKGNKPWIWLAIDASTRKIVRVYIGSRKSKEARELRKSLPAVYRQYTLCCTDFWSAYRGIFAKKRHRAVGKETGKSYDIERFNNMIRQRISRLGGKVLSFSKKLSNHPGAIWYFIHHYNASLQTVGKT